ncbi:MAG: hypothetical protein JSU01_02370 [Bacteroidetes bacterium]|nr:hypothetical protein [Bacteroidota bacterium]
MKEHNEQLDLIEEALQQLIQRLAAIEEKLNRLTDTKPPEQASIDTEPLQSELQETRQDFKQLGEKILAPIRQLNERVAGIPTRMPVEHHHHFNERSKGFIIGAFILLIVTAGSSGLSLSLWSENRSLHSQEVKYGLVGLVSPWAVHWADTAYARDPEGVLQATKDAIKKRDIMERQQKTIHKKAKRAND